MEQKNFVEEEVLEILPDSVVLGGEKLEGLLRKHLHIVDTGKRIRLGLARVSIEWIKEYTGNVAATPGTAEVGTRIPPEGMRGPEALPTPRDARRETSPEPPRTPPSESET